MDNRRINQAHWWATHPVFAVIGLALLAAMVAGVLLLTKSGRKNGLRAGDGTEALSPSADPDD